MMKTKLTDIKFTADLTFFAVLAMFAFFDTGGYALMSLAACLIHELGHLVAMLIRGQKPTAITFRGGGVCIDTPPESTPSLFVLIAGSAANFGVFVGAFFVAGQPHDELFPIMFAFTNLWIGLFNLLPIGCLDGNRILARFLPAKVLRVIEVVTVIAVVTAVAAMIFRGEVNFTLLAVMIYVIAVDFWSKVCYD